MPICHNDSKINAIAIASVDVDHEAAEIAKAKISREQAYFNSYDFDAIEVLSFDESDEVQDTDRDDCDSISKRRKQVADIDGSSDYVGVDSERKPVDVVRQIRSGSSLRNLIAYLPKVSNAVRSAILQNASNDATEEAGKTLKNVDSPCIENSSEQRSVESSSSGGSSRKLFCAEDGDVVARASRNNFSLPRAMLKCPSSLAPINSMSVTGVLSSVASNNMCNLTTAKYKGQRSGPQYCEKTDGRLRERAISSSHYSTDKSGSSGYYSSRVCSTSSVEEHIYSEPVIDVIHTRLVSPSKQGTLPLQQTLQKQNSTTVQEKSQVLRPSDNYYNVQIEDDNRISDELRCLEDSIKSLDRHLKTYPGLNGTVSSRTSHAPSLRPSECIVYDEACLSSVYDRHKSPMPTIMEGSDTILTSLKPHLSWPEDLDDSLMDIDLDSFRLVNEISRKSMKKKGATKNLQGIDNPSFDKSEVLDEVFLENNYKCSKYINSCPEDAYHVESVVESLRGRTTNETHCESNKKHLGFFLKRYEDQIHFQSTKDMLEDIRNKVNALTTSASKQIDDNSGYNVDRFHPDLQNIMRKDLENYIGTLKQELEVYLSLMNHHNELEIKQLCTGLVNDQKLVTITKAFERRKSLASDISSSLSYEPLRSAKTSTLPYIYTSERIIDDNATIASSDPNFQLKRKPEPDDEDDGNEMIFHHPHTSPRPDRPSVDKRSVDDVRKENLGKGNTLRTTSIGTQFQKNMSLQRPVLDKKSSKLNGKQSGHTDKDSMLEWHKNKPSIWEQYYGTNRMNQTLTGKRGQVVKNPTSMLSYTTTHSEENIFEDLEMSDMLTQEAIVQPTQGRKRHSSASDTKRSSTHQSPDTLPSTSSDFKTELREMTVRALVNISANVRVNDEFSAFGDYIASELRSLNADQAKFAKRKLARVFNDVIDEALSMPSSRPESDFTLDLPRAEQLRIKMDKEKKFRHRCRILTTFLSLIFFLLTVIVVSLILTRGKRMFGSML